MSQLRKNRKFGEDNIIQLAEFRSFKKNKPELWTPNNLLIKLERWLNENKAAVQLDGLSKIQSNPTTFCLIIFCDEIFRLQNDTRRSAIKRFVKNARRIGLSAELAFGMEVFSKGKLKSKPINADSKEGRNSDGWFCFYHRTATESEIKLTA